MIKFGWNFNLVPSIRNQEFIKSLNNGNYLKYCDLVAHINLTFPDKNLSAFALSIWDDLYELNVPILPTEDKTAWECENLETLHPLGTNRVDSILLRLGRTQGCLTRSDILDFCFNHGVNLADAEMVYELPRDVLNFYPEIIIKASVSGTGEDLNLQ